MRDRRWRPGAFPVSGQVLSHRAAFPALRHRGDFSSPWAFIYREFLADGIPILLPILGFLGLLTLGLFYEIKKGALDWER